LEWCGVPNPPIAERRLAALGRQPKKSNQEEWPQMKNQMHTDERKDRIANDLSVSIIFICGNFLAFGTD
jgi:hypothetical protein